MNFEEFFRKCQTESTVSDFESYLACCVFGKSASELQAHEQITLEMYSYIRDQAFEKRDEKAARLLHDLAKAANWKEGDWQGMLR
jgi:hypothetical protein